MLIYETLQATDPDLGGNGLIEYRIAGNNNEFIPFAVDSAEGTITPKQEFIPRDAKQYDFTATALDTPQTGDRLRAETRVIVSLYMYLCNTLGNDNDIVFSLRQLL
jgi:hypothetical protein